jgi:IQ and AAA domain-containing protein
LDKDRAAKGKKVKKGGKKARRSGKKGKKKKEKDLTPDRTTESLFEELVVNGILVKYPEFYMQQYLGDRAYAARMPTNPAPGDIRQVIKEYCILPLGSQMIRNFAPCIKSILIAGELGEIWERPRLINCFIFADKRAQGNWQTIPRTRRGNRDRFNYV